MMPNGSFSNSGVEPEIGLARLLLFCTVGSLVVHEAAFFYWLHHIYLQHGGDPGEIVFALEWIPLAPALFLLFYSKAALDPLPRNWSLAFWFFFALLSLGSCLGVMNAYELQHYLGDVGKFVVPWAALYLTLRAGMTLARLEGPRSLEPYMNVILGLSIVDAVDTIYVALRSGQHGINLLYFFALAWALVQRRYPALLSVALVFLCSRAALFSNKRFHTVLLFFTLFAGLVYLLAAGRLKRLSILAVGFLAVGFITTGAFLAAPQNMLSGQSATVSRFIGIIQVVTGRASDSSFRARENEGADVVDFMEKSPGWLLTGLGFGAEVPAVYPTSLENERGHIHHVHMAIYVFLLRNGLLGLLLVGLFIWKVMGIGKGLFPPHSEWAVICMIFCLGRAIGIFTNNFILGLVDISIVAAFGCVFAAFPYPAPAAGSGVLKDESLSKSTSQLYPWGGLS